MISLISLHLCLPNPSGMEVKTRFKIIVNLINGLILFQTLINYKFFGVLLNILNMLNFI